MKYRCHNFLDTMNTSWTFDEKQEILGSQNDPQCQFYAIDEEAVNDCLTQFDSSSSSFLECIGNLKNDVSTVLKNCDSYVYDDDFITESGIYSGYENKKKMKRF